MKRLDVFQFGCQYIIKISGVIHKMKRGDTFRFYIFLATVINYLVFFLTNIFIGILILDSKKHKETIQHCKPTNKPTVQKNHLKIFYLMHSTLIMHFLYALL